MAESWRPEHTARWLRMPGPHDNKYRRGVLGVRTGSAAYPGAAVLGVSAAWRTGTGLLRYVPPVGEMPSPLGLPSPAAAVLAACPETVFGAPTGRPCDAWLIGSGTDPATRSAAETEALTRVLTGNAPVVVDAGALSLVAEHAAQCQGSLSRAPLAPVILTPHRGEFERLWAAARLGTSDGGEEEAGDAGIEDQHAATQLAARLGATVLLKGSVTMAAAPSGEVFAVGPATPWLATAGTGDVLAGILGALVAGHAERVREDPSLLAQLGAAAAHLHDAAARLAAGTPAGPITALDVADALPAAIAQLLAG